MGEKAKAIKPKNSSTSTSTANNVSKGTLSARSAFSSRHNLFEMNPYGSDYELDGNLSYIPWRLRLMISIMT